jgi:hypothetical protein
MKSPTLTPLTSSILKLVGIVLILYYLIDLVLYLTAANFQNNQWVMTLTTQLVDRGFIPLVGLALLFAGYWVEGTSDTAKGSSQGLKLTVLWLASVLGLMFLLIVPLNVNATRLAAEDQVNKIEQEAKKATDQLDAQVQQFKSQLDPQLTAIDQAIKGGQFQGAQLEQAKRQQEQLQKLKADPKALEAQIAPQRDQKLKEINDQKKQLEDQTYKGALQTGMRVGLNSLLLAIVYALIGWTGLRQMFYAQPRSN